jgi:CheY-like chemotaxis protein
MTTLNTILELSELESNKFLMTINKVNIYSSLMLVLKEFEEKAIQKGLVLEYQFEEKNLVSFIDENIFSKIIINLVDNALKFTSIGGVKVKLSSDGGLDDGLFAKISVSDTGIGIDDKDIEIIFHEFRQASEGLGRNFEGNGLGLTLARKMARLMEGDITVESILGKGSTFTYTIPAQIENTFNTDYSIEKNIHRADEVGETSFNILPEILLVEDNLINKEVVEVFLRGICKIDHAIDGEGAIKMALQKHYDTILMDINLGSGLTGVDVVKEIKKHSSNRDIPIVALTGYAMLGDKEKFLQAGMTNYLAKPFTKDELINEIKLILKDKVR